MGAAGSVDVLRVALPAMLGRGFAATIESGLLAAAGGVAVLEVVDMTDVLVKPSCFVGDFVGDRMPLATLPAGVGVPGVTEVRRSCRSVCLRAPFAAV